ncbi:MAG: phage major tail tube protein [Clostridia bacterium]
MYQPEAYIDFEVYEDSVNFVGISKATMPDIAFLTQTMTGAGIAGNVDAVLTGMTEAMNLKLEFRSPNGAAVSLMKPVKHNIELRIAEQHWDTVAVAKTIAADKYVMVVMPKKLSVGSIAPASAADSSGEYSVYYYAGYKDGKVIWEIDPFNYICAIDGVDYMSDVREALGK